MTMNLATAHSADKRCAIFVQFVRRKTSKMRHSKFR